MILLFLHVFIVQILLTDGVPQITGVSPSTNIERVQNDGTLTIKWQVTSDETLTAGNYKLFFNNGEFAPTFLHPIVAGFNSYQITFLVLIPSDAGTYVLQVTDSTGAVNSTVNLTVLPIISAKITSTFSDITLKYGHSATFVCETNEARPPVTIINWYKDTTTKLTNTTSVYSLTGPLGRELTILNMTRNNTGQYYCEAIVDTSHLAHSQPFNVEYSGLPPGKVNELSANHTVGSESTSIILTWSPPTDLGRNNISEISYLYKACAPSATNCTETTTKKTQATVENLKPNTLYEITVYSLSGQGERGEGSVQNITTSYCTSEQFRCVTGNECIANNLTCNGNQDCTQDTSDETNENCSAPTTVQNITATNVTSSSITINFNPSQIPIQYYTVWIETTKDNLLVMAKNITSSSTSRSATFDMLVAKTEYNVKVIAYNYKGQSAVNGTTVTTLESIPGPIIFQNITWTEYSETSGGMLSWKPPTNLGGLNPKDVLYKITWCINNTCTMQNVTNGTSDLTLTISFMSSPAGSLNVTLVAVNTLGQEGEKFMDVMTVPNRDTCAMNFHTCMSGMPFCVPQVERCDDVTQCADGSDETNQYANCTLPDIKLNPKIETLRWNYVNIMWTHNTTTPPLYYKTNMTCTKNSTNGAFVMEYKELNCILNCTLEFENVNGTNCLFAITAQYLAGSGKKFELNIAAPNLEPPSAPQNFTTDPNQNLNIYNKMSFIWSLPANTGFQLATTLGYVTHICYWKGCFGPFEVPVNQLGTTIEGLRRNTTYNTSVAAKNLLGVVGPTASLEFTTINSAPTGPVQDITYQPDGNRLSDSQIIKWNNPTVLNLNNASLLRFNLTYCKENTMCESVMINSTATTPFEYVLHNLSDSTNYSFQIFAVNEFDDYSEATIMYFMTKTCDVGFFECVTRPPISFDKCVDVSKLCDKINDCPSGSDETFQYAKCNFTGPVRQLSASHSLGHENTQFLVSWLQPDELNNVSLPLTYLVTVCSLNNSMVHTCKNLLPIVTSNLSISLTVQADMLNTTSYQVQVQTLTLGKETSIVESVNFTSTACGMNEYKCLNGSVLCVPKENICNGMNECMDGSDEMEQAGCVPPSRKPTLIVESNTLIDIAWPPSQPNDLITGFNLSLYNSATNETRTVSLPKTAMKYSFVNLTRNTLYQLTFVIYNPAGAYQSVENATTSRFPLAFRRTAWAMDNWFTKFKILSRANQNIVQGCPSEYFSQVENGLKKGFCALDETKCNMDNACYAAHEECDGVAQCSSNAIDEDTCPIPTKRAIAIPAGLSTQIPLIWTGNNPREGIRGFNLTLLNTVNNKTRMVTLPSNATKYTFTDVERNSSYVLTFVSYNYKADREQTLNLTTQQCSDSSEFTCSSGDQCIPKDQTCDNTYQCDDQSDETALPPAFCAHPFGITPKAIALYGGVILDFGIPPTNFTTSYTLLEIKIDGERTIELNVTSFDNITVQNSSIFLPATQYTFSIRPMNLIGYGFKTFATFLTLGPVQPAPPIPFKNDYFSLSVILQNVPTNQNQTIQGYEVETTDPNGKIQTFTLMANETMFTLTGLNHSTTGYMIRYRAKDKDGYSKYSMVLGYATKVLGIPQSIPSISLLSKTFHHLEIMWESSPGDLVTSQVLMYNSNGTNATRIELAGNTTKYSIENLMEETSYTVTISAVNDAGESNKTMVQIKTDPNICPGYDWILNNGYCYYFGNNGGKGVTQSKAAGNCKDMDSSLSSIHSEKENMFLENQLKKSNYAGAFIGLTQTMNGFNWSNNAIVNFTSFKNSTGAMLPNPSYNNNKTCVVLMETTWALVNCECGRVVSSSNCSVNDVYGYICQRQDVTSQPIKPTQIGQGWNKLNISWPKTSSMSRDYQVEYNNAIHNVTQATMFTLMNLTEFTTYAVRVREMYMGYGPWSARVTVTTRAFIPSDPANKFTVMAVQHKESQSVILTWLPGNSSKDSMMENIRGMVEYMYDGGKPQTMNMLRSGDNITGLMANTRYTFSLKLYDVTNKKSSDAVSANHNTSEIDSCRTEEWLCSGLSYCVLNSTLCDNNFNCENGADEMAMAGCAVPDVVNVTMVTEGLTFVKIFWEDQVAKNRIRYYRLTINDTVMHMNYNASLNDTSFRFGNLIANRTYEISIVAVNPTGEGTPVMKMVKTAEFSNATGPVLSLQSKLQSLFEDSQVAISWNPPDVLNDNDVSTLLYQIDYCYDNNSSVCMNYVTNVTSAILRNLTRGVKYEFAVSVITEYGKMSSNMTGTFETEVCKSTYWQCNSSRQCVAMDTMLCNGVNDCLDGSDEGLHAECAPPIPVNITVRNVGLKFVILEFEIGKEQRTSTYNLTISQNVNTVLSESFDISDTLFITNELAKDTTYDVIVTQNNPTGSTESRLNFTTLAAAVPPGKVRDLAVTPTEFKESSSVHLQWKYPMMNTGGEEPNKLNYSVKYCTTGTPKVCSDRVNIPPPANVSNEMYLNDSVLIEYTLTGLAINQEYEIEVGAVVDELGEVEKRTFKTATQDSCMSGYFRCPVLCISPDKVCDNIMDCVGTVDETNCTDAPPSVQNIKQPTQNTVYNRISLVWDDVIGENYTGENIISYIATVNCGQTTQSIKTNMTKADFEKTHDGFEQVNCSVAVVASNFVGNSSVSEMIIETVALGTPGEPQNITISNVTGWESSNKTIAWELPSELGNAPVEEITFNVKYCIVYNDSGALANCTETNVSGTEFSVGGLLKGTPYAFLVTSINPNNMVGATPAAITSETTFAGAVPSAPRFFTSIEHDTDPHKIIVLSWKPPVLLPGLSEQTVRYRIVFCVKGDEPCEEPVFTEAGVTGYNLVELDENTVYTVELRAVGANGVDFGEMAYVEHTTDKSGLANWKIAVIVIAVMLALIIIIALIANAHFKKKYTSNYSTKGGDKETSRMNSGYADDAV